VVELEMRYIYRRLGIGANQHSAPFLLKLTLGDWVQFQFGSNGLTRASQPAPAFFFDDVTAGAISPADNGLLTGLSFAPSHWIVLDIGVDLSLLPSTRSANAFIGFSIIPLDLWDTEAERQARAARFIRHER
jgi:hypothetical protein